MIFFFRRKVYTLHAGYWSYLFNLIRSTLCTTLTFLLLYFLFFILCKCVPMSVLGTIRFLVHFSLGNKVELYCIVLKLRCD